MRTLTFLATLFTVSALSAEDESPDQLWIYRGAGLMTTNHNSLGRAGEVVAYTLSTPDKVENVVKWYGERFGLSKKHTLMLAADARFAPSRTISTAPGRSIGTRTSSSTQPW